MQKHGKTHILKKNHLKKWNVEGENQKLVSAMKVNDWTCRNWWINKLCSCNEMKKNSNVGRTLVMVHIGCVKSGCLWTKEKS